MTLIGSPLGSAESELEAESESELEAESESELEAESEVEAELESELSLESSSPQLAAMSAMNASTASRRRATFLLALLEPVMKSPVCFLFVEGVAHALRSRIVSADQPASQSEP